MAQTRCGISAKQIQRETGVTYKTAWRMFHQIRTLLQEEDPPISGEAEMDETYIGGRMRGKGRGYKANKAAVFGVVERKGRVTARLVPNTQGKTLAPIIKARVLPRATVYSDEAPVYDRLPRLGYVHRRIHHASRVYVDGDVHTNTIEGFWSLLKRGIDGVYHAVSQKHLQSYLNEYAFRYNHRKDEVPMFQTILAQVQKASPSG
jgi:transposase-like protein